MTAVRVGAGWVEIDPLDGMPRAFGHPQAPERRYVLDESTEGWHTAEHRWGSGFVITDHGTARWNAPSEVRFDGDRVDSRHPLGNGLELLVQRTGGDALRESYRLVNPTAAPVTVLSMGITVPIRDIYPSATESLRTAVHAHVFTGGSWAWLLAQPMDGTPPLLGLRLTRGHLDAYSIDSRNTYSFSNIRGHIVLQPTDFGRNAESFGGQSPIVIPPGGEHETAWELGWYESADAFIAATSAPARFSRLVAEAGGFVEFRTPADTPVRVAHPATVLRDGESVRVSAPVAGTVDVFIGDARTAVLFHDPVAELVADRVDYILRHQRARERAGIDRFAFVPVDTRTGLTMLTSGWADWSDGAERVAMPALLQQARLRGWVRSTEEVDEALIDWARFARQRLLDETAAPLWGSDTIITKTRLYNSPWLAHFFADQYRLYGLPDDLELAARILERSFELGAETHVSIGQPEAILAVAELLDAVGQIDRAGRLRAGMLANAAHFAALGEALPSHEVNYEQSIVAPLVSLFALAGAESGDGRFLEPLETALRWLRAFGGPQPHARLNNIGIRHWDGYFFGLNRQWGDVFPHHWSGLSAVALTQLPESLRTAESDDAASRIFLSNLASYRSDGAATAAFVFPSTVDSRRAHEADPMANDQDWPLTLWLRTGWGLDAPDTARAERRLVRR